MRIDNGYAIIAVAAFALIILHLVGVIPGAR